MSRKSEIVFPGAKYDALTVLERIPKQGKACNVCRCRCDCGKIVTIQEQRISRRLRKEGYKRLDCGCGIANPQGVQSKRTLPANLPKEPKKKYCKRYNCLYHPVKHAANNCDYFWVTGKYREKDENGKCLSYIKATPAEKHKLKVGNAVKQKFFGGGIW